MRRVIPRVVSSTGSVSGAAPFHLQHAGHRLCAPGCATSPSSGPLSVRLITVSSLRKAALGVSARRTARGKQKDDGESMAFRDQAHHCAPCFKVKRICSTTCGVGLPSSNFQLGNLAAKDAEYAGIDADQATAMRDGDARQHRCVADDDALGAESGQQRVQLVFPDGSAAVSPRRMRRAGCAALVLPVRDTRAARADR